MTPWGCHSKPRQDGYWGTSATVTDSKGRRIQQAVWIKDTGTKECQYRKDKPIDPRCEGCTSP